MLTKEYRIPLPMTVEEYRIAQLYMIAKKSREESEGEESGVEILVNEPYTNGPGPGGKPTNGQYTHKIYHIGSHLPAWFKNLLPKSALSAEEKAWNAYPYTKTIFTCPFVDKFSLEIETFFTPDGGHLENVFNLSKSERNRIESDLIDVVKDNEGAYFEDPEKEDPTVYVSEKTGRGPLESEWIADTWADCKGKQQPTPNGNSIMCAYKLCKVEFRYWGMQTKIERFIHDVALRKTMLKAHSQAWVWQDEWTGLTIEDVRAIEKETAKILKKKFHQPPSDIREIERQTAEMLKKKYHGGGDDEEEDGDSVGGSGSGDGSPSYKRGSIVDAVGGEEGEPKGAAADSEDGDETAARSEAPPPVTPAVEQPPAEPAGPTLDQEAKSKLSATFNSMEYSEAEVPNIIPKGTEKVQRRSLVLEEEAAAGALSAGGVPIPRSRSRATNASAARSPRMSAASDDETEDEFFDAEDHFADQTLAKWSSMDLTAPDDTACPSDRIKVPGTDEVQMRRVHSMYEKSNTSPVPSLAHPDHPHTASNHQTTSHQGFNFRRTIPDHQAEGCCPTTVLILVVHGGSVLDPQLEMSVRKSDVTTFRGAFESIVRTHYPSLVGHVVIKCVPCPGIGTEALTVLSSLSPYSFDVNPELGNQTGVSNDRLPIGTIPLFASASPDYINSLNTVIGSANKVYNEFLQSEDGMGFCGQVSLVGDSVGSILAYDALCRPYTSSQGRRLSESSVAGHEEEGSSPGGSRTVVTSKSDNLHEGPRLDFDVVDFFTFGSPLAIVLAFRKILTNDPSKRGDHQKTVPRPAVQQMYNLFHPSDPIAHRIEPLLSAKFSRAPPVNVPRYQKYPMGDGASHFLSDFIQTNTQLFAASGENNGLSQQNSGGGRRGRRLSEESTVSGAFDTQQLHSIQLLKPKWWGNKRIDYALYCPDGLTNFPTNCLPHLFHSSYWESHDVISFLLRQLAGTSVVDCAPDSATTHPSQGASGLSKNLVADFNSFTPNQPLEKWIKKRTSVKIRNGAANHRGNDVIVTEGCPQVLVGRFSYGPLDMSALTGEKVDVHIMKEPPGEWTYISTQLTDKHGKISFVVPREHSMSFGIYPVRMLVRGDHTMLHLSLAVVPLNTETVVFSIDGSFAASVSVTGKDPKVTAGAVDVVRHWQELGYLIVYVTGRPDMQLLRVVSWLSQHNFPHGLVSFADGFSTDPLRHKAEYLKGLINDQRLIIHKAYGSAKDITVYSSLGLSPDDIFVVGKPPSGKRQSAATYLSEGYADHLSQLSAHGGSRPAQGNARMVIPRSTFGLPGQGGVASSLQRRRTMTRANAASAAAKRTTSFPLNNGEGSGRNSINVPGTPGGSSMTSLRTSSHI